MNARKMLTLAKERHLPVKLLVAERTENVAGSVESLSESDALVRQHDGDQVCVPFDDVRVVAI